MQSGVFPSRLWSLFILGVTMNHLTACFQCWWQVDQRCSLGLKLCSVGEKSGRRAECSIVPSYSFKSFQSKENSSNFLLTWSDISTNRMPVLLVSVKLSRALKKSKWMCFSLSFLFFFVEILNSSSVSINCLWFFLRQQRTSEIFSQFC